VTKSKTSITKSRKRQGPQQGGRRGASAFSFLVLGAMMVFMPAMTALLLVGMLPTLVVLFVDNSPEKGSRLSAMFAFNASGVLPYAISLWEKGLQMQAVVETLGDVVAWTIMYGAAGAGAMSLWLGPVVVAATRQIMNYDRVTEIERERAALIAEWGEDVTRRMSD